MIIKIIDSADVEIVNPDGKTYLVYIKQIFSNSKHNPFQVRKEILEQEGIDINNLTDDSIQLLYNMTLPSEYVNKKIQS